MSLSLSRQPSLDVISNDSDNTSTKHADTLCSHTSFESSANENSRLLQTMDYKGPSYTEPVAYRHEGRNLLDGHAEDRETFDIATAKHQHPESRFLTRETEFLRTKTTESRQSNFPSPLALETVSNIVDITKQYPTSAASLKSFSTINEYYNTARDILLECLCIQLQVPVEIKHKKSILNEEIRLVTQLRRTHLHDFVKIQNVELQLNHLRDIEKEQMTEIQEKLAEIQNAKCGLTYPRYSKSRVGSNYSDLNYYNYYAQRPYYRYPYQIYQPQTYYQAAYNYPIYKYDHNLEDQRSAYSIQSSPHYLSYGGSYPKELRFNAQYYIDPVPNHSRNYSRSTDQIAINNYQNYPIELSHSEQGLVNVGYNYPTNNIDIELMHKEQRVYELEREIELRKRQIEETIRYQEELQHLAELNNSTSADYNNSYLQPNADEVIEYDQINNYFITEEGQQFGQYADENHQYTYDNLPPNPTNQQQYSTYYEDMYQQTDVPDNVLYTEPIFQSDPYYQTRQVPKCDNVDYHSKLYDSESENVLDQPQQEAKYLGHAYRRFETQVQDQLAHSVPQDTTIELVQTKRSNSKANLSRPFSGEYENVTENESNFVDHRQKPENPARKVTKSHRRKVTEKSKKHYSFPTKRLLLMRDSKEKNLRGNGVGMRIIGGQLCSDGHLGAFVEEIFSGSVADRIQDQVKEGNELIEWNGVPLIGKTFEDVRAILRHDSDEIEILVRVGAISKSTEASKGNSDTSEQNTVKSLTSAYDIMTIREPIDQPQVKKHPKFADEASSPDNHNERRQHSSKIQKAQECDSTLVTRTPPKAPSPIKESAPLPPSNKDIDCGSPTVIKRESPINPPVAPRPRHSSKEITPVKSEMDKEDVDTEKDDSTSEKVLGSIQLIISFDDYDQSLTIHVARAKHLLPMDLNGLSDPFVKIRLHPDPTEDPDYNRQTRYMPNTLVPEWQQTMVFMNILKRSLKKRVLDISVWDFDRLKANDFMGQVLISLANKQILDNKPHWYKLTHMKEVDIPGLRQPARAGTDSKASTKIAKMKRKP